MKKALLLSIIMALSLTACTVEYTVTVEPGDEEEYQAEMDSAAEDEGFATKDDPADARQENTVIGYEGTFTFKLINAYAGDAAISQLKEMGENTEDYEDYTDGEAVLMEYYVSADSGFKEYAFDCYDLVGMNLWDTNMHSKYEFWMLDLYKNAEYDYSNVTLQAGEESKVYILYEIEADIDSFILQIDGQNRSYYFLCELEK